MDIQQIKRELLALHKYGEKLIDVENKKLVTFTKKFFTTKLNQTLKHPSFGNPQNRPPGFQGAKPNVEVKIKKNNGDNIVDVYVVMGHGGTQAPHRIWHVISGGRKSYKAKKRTVFPIRVAARTFPNQYNVGRFPGWAGWVTIPKGGTIGGIEPRNFYDSITKEYIKEVISKFPDFKITKLNVKETA